MLLLIVGFVLKVQVLWTIGVILLVIGAVLWVSRCGRASDRRPPLLVLTAAFTDSAAAVMDRSTA